MKKIIDWDQYFLGIAILSSYRSKDPNTQTGSCIVNQNNRIIGIGYNGMPGGKDELPWKRDGDFLETKYAYVVHAETNAILNSVTPTSKARLYTTLFPCNECAKIIVQTGIKKIFYLSDKYHDLKEFIAARKIFDCNQVEYQAIKNHKLMINIKD